jgi:hypothetical protein
VDLGADHIGNVFVQFILNEDTIALVIKHFSLLIKDIIVFKQVLTGIKIGPLNPGLRLLYRTVHHVVGDWDRIIDIEPLHQV